MANETKQTEAIKRMDDHEMATPRILTTYNTRRPATVLVDGEDLSNLVYEADLGTGRVGLYVRDDDGLILDDDGEPKREQRQARQRLVVVDAKGRKWGWRPMS